MYAIRMLALGLGLLAVSHAALRGGTSTTSHVRSCPGETANSVAPAPPNLCDACLPYLKNMSNSNLAKSCFAAAYCGRRCFENGNLGNCPSYAPVFDNKGNQAAGDLEKTAEMTCLMRKVEADYADAAKQSMTTTSTTTNGRKLQAKECKNLPGWVDLNNIDCGPFDANPEHAKQWCGNPFVKSAEGVPAKLACCACGGGVDAFLNKVPFDGAAASSSLEYASGPHLDVAKGDTDAFKGIGDLVQLGLKATPFATDTVTTTGGPASAAPQVRFTKSAIQSSSDLKKAYKATVEAQGSYGAFTGAGSASYATNTHLTSKSSIYMLNYDASFPATLLDEGRTELRQDAIELLKQDPGQFKVQYGTHYIAGYVTGCQVTVKVTTTAKTEAQKDELDAAAEASYASMASVKSTFTSDVTTNSAFQSMKLDFDNKGARLHTSSLQDDTDVREQIETPLMNGEACTAESAKVLRVIVKPWRSNTQISKHITAEGRAALTPAGMYSTDLDTLNLLMMQVQGLKAKASKCSENVFSCSTQAWTENPQHRQNLYQAADVELRDLLFALKKLTESDLVANPGAMLTYQTRVDDIYRNYMREAERMPTLNFKFRGWMTSKWSSTPMNYKGGYTRENAFPFELDLKVDPNRAQNEGPMGTWVWKQLDNNFSWPDWVTGNFYAMYNDGVLDVWQCWKRHAPFGPSNCEDREHFQFRPGQGKQSAVQSGINGDMVDADVNADYSFTVGYGNPFTGQRTSQCRNKPGWVDLNNIDCGPFDANPEHAKQWCGNPSVRSADFVPAKWACCACGGGEDY